MPHTMELKDGTVTTLLQYKDFLELVDSYMGYEARRYLEEMQCDLAGLEKDMEYAEKEYERQGDHQRNVLNNIREEAETLDALLLADRLDRKRIQTSVKRIRQTVMQEL